MDFDKKIFHLEDHFDHYESAKRQLSPSLEVFLFSESNCIESTTTMMPRPACLVLLTICLPLTAAVRNLRIASPLQTLTLWDKPPSTPRSRFLPRFKAGLQAEAEVRKEATQATETPEANAVVGGESSSNWAQQAARADRKRKARVEQAAARAFEQAFAQADQQEDTDAAVVSTATTTPRSSKYQFVGVVNPRNRRQGDGSSSSKPPITWYARPKTGDSPWSVRLVHVNQRAVVYDLFRRGKVDLFAKYQNQGKVVTEEGVTTRQPIIKAEYVVRERSWKYVSLCLILFCFVCGRVLQSCHTMCKVFMLLFLPASCTSHLLIALCSLD